MGLACSQVQLLMLTSRKADVECDIAIRSRQKMALTMEQSDLSREYRAKLNSKNLAYYSNGQYNKLNYGYLMGYGLNTFGGTKQRPLKDNNAVVLTDSRGLVVMDNNYTSILLNVLGSSAMDSSGRGGTFSRDVIPQIIAQVLCTSVENIQAVIDGESVNMNYPITKVNTLTGQATGETGNHDATDTYTSALKAKVDFFYPIFLSAATNGWTSEYNQEMASNSDYINDALISGAFQLAEIEDDGNYAPDTSLTYFVMSGLVEQRTDSDVREEITAWYNAEKERISAKEDFLDIDIRDLSTELEAINTEIDSVKSLIQDAMKVFEWGSS